ncbi:MAG: PAS domain S-box protein, partial [bacterium]|nr:PAS domain S-box protein [bacterium]
MQILYLEDDARDVELVRDTLQQSSLAFELRIATNRADYEAALAQTRFGLILSDYRLPDYDGMAALAMARTHQRDVPFILISGTLGDEQAVDCVLRGATDYVLKQRLNRLVPAVMRALAEAAEHQKRCQVEEKLRTHQIELELQNEELRQAHAALDTARARYFDLYDMAPAGYVTVSEAGLILEANLSAATLLGRGRNTLATQPIFTNFILKEDQDTYYRHRQQLFATGVPRTYELRMVKKDGTPVWVHLAASIAQEAARGAEPVCRIVLSDISARKQVEAYQEMGREILQILHEPGAFSNAVRRVLDVIKCQTGCAAVGIRLQAGDDFPYIAQAGFADAFLATESSLIAHTAEGEICRDSDGNISLECTCGLVISGKIDPRHPLFTRGGSFWTNNAMPLLHLPVEQDPRLHPRNQCMRHGYASMALVPIRNQDRIIGLIHLSDQRQDCFTIEVVTLMEGIAVHIGTALMRKQAEEALRESEEKYRQIFENAGDAIFIHDVQGRMLAVNPLDCERLGYTHAELMAMTIAQVDTPAEACHVAGRTAHLLEHGQHAFETVQQCQDGTPVATEVHARRILWNGQPAMMSMCRDIRERKRAEEELLKMQKLQSVGTLAGGIAHDFNNIMTGLFGNISLAKSELAKEHPVHALLEEAEKSMNRAVRLTKQLLTFAKGGAPVKEDVSLGGLVEEVARFDLSGSKVKLVLQQAEGLWLAEVDKGQIQQVISNLTINARHAMPDGGQLYITLENAAIPAEAIVGLQRGNYVKVIVRDEGSGIDPKHLARIFDPYFTTKQSGSGLGLATAYAVIQKHGGYIDVVSELGHGATFTLYLPASVTPPQAVVAPPTAASAPAARRARILVMDDEPSICAIVARMLKSSGCAVVAAPDGVKLFIATAAGYEDATEKWGLAGASATSAAAADVNGDGKPDLLLGGTIWMNEGGKFAAAKPGPQLPADADQIRGPTGGYAWFAETAQPLFALPPTLQSADCLALRIQEGDDASCLNPQQVLAPQVVGVPSQRLAERGAFTFADSLPGGLHAGSWRMLADPVDNAVPAVVD